MCATFQITTTTITMTTETSTSAEVTSSTENESRASKQKDVHEEKHDSGKASDSGSSSSASSVVEDIVIERQTQKSKTSENAMSFSNANMNGSVSVDKEEEIATVKSNDSGVCADKGIQANPLAEARRGSYMRPDPVATDPTVPPPFVYVPIRDPGYDAYKSWRIRNEMYRRKPLPIAFMGSGETLRIADDDEEVFNEYPTVRSRGGPNYGMVMVDGSHTLGGRRRAPAVPMGYGATSLSATGMSRRDMMNRVYADFDDDAGGGYDGILYARRPAYQNIEEVVDDVIIEPPPYIGGAATSRVYVDGIYDQEELMEVRSAAGGLGGGGGGGRLSYVDGRGMVDRRMRMSGGDPRSAAAYYRDVYDRDGLHIGLSGRTEDVRMAGGVGTTGERRSQQQQQQQHQSLYTSDGAYPTSSKRVGGEAVDAELAYSGRLALPGNANGQQVEARKLRRQLSSSHKYAGYAWDEQVSEYL